MGSAKAVSVFTSPLQLVNVIAALKQLRLRLEDQIYYFLPSHSVENNRQVYQLLKNYGLSFDELKILQKGSRFRDMELRLLARDIEAKAKSVAKQNSIEFVIVGDIRPYFSNVLLQSFNCQVVLVDDGTIIPEIAETRIEGDAPPLMLECPFRSSRAVRQFYEKNWLIESIQFMTSFPIRGRFEDICQVLDAQPSSSKDFKIDESRVWFLGNNHVESGITKSTKYFAAFNEVISKLGDRTVEYIPHRREEETKLNLLSEVFGVPIIKKDCNVEEFADSQAALPANIVTFFSSAVISLSEKYRFLINVHCVRPRGEYFETSGRHAQRSMDIIHSIHCSRHGGINFHDLAGGAGLDLQPASLEKRIDLSCKAPLIPDWIQVPINTSSLSQFEVAYSPVVIGIVARLGNDRYELEIDSSDLKKIFVSCVIYDGGHYYKVEYIHRNRLEVRALGQCDQAAFPYSHFYVIPVHYAFDGFLGKRVPAGIVLNQLRAKVPLKVKGDGLKERSSKLYFESDKHSRHRLKYAKDSSEKFVAGDLVELSFLGVGRSVFKIVCFSGNEIAGELYFQADQEHPIESSSAEDCSALDVLSVRKVDLNVYINLEVVTPVDRVDFVLLPSAVARSSYYAGNGFRGCELDLACYSPVSTVLGTDAYLSSQTMTFDLRRLSALILYVRARASSHGELSFDFGERCELIRKKVPVGDMYRIDLTDHLKEGVDTLRILCSEGEVLVSSIGYR